MNNQATPFPTTFPVTGNALGKRIYPGAPFDLTDYFEPKKET